MRAMAGASAALAFSAHRYGVDVAGPELARRALERGVARVAGQVEHAVDQPLAVMVEEAALLAKRLQRAPVAAEDDVHDLVLVRGELLARRRAGEREQLIDLLLADALEAPLRLAALAMAVLHEPPVRLRIDERIAAVEAHREAAEPQQEERDGAPPLQQVHERRRVDAVEVERLFDRKRRDDEHGVRRALEQRPARRRLCGERDDAHE